MKIVHVPTPVGGHPGGLARAERALGHDSVAVSLLVPPFGHAVDEVLARPGDGPAARALQRGRLLRRLLSRDVDVVHFNFGRTLFPVPAGRGGIRDGLASLLALRDLELLHRRGKVIAVTFQGDDARQAVVGGPLVAAVPEHYTPQLDAARCRTIAAFDRWADAIFFLNPDLAAVLPGRAVFVPYASVDPREWAPAVPEDGPPLVVHAPSDPRVKGTGHVVAAIEQLRRDGVPLRFELLQGLSQDEVRRAVERSALVVDQLLAGWYGAFAVEAMALGKPVASSVGTAALPSVPRGLRDELPIVDVGPATVAERLRELLLDRDRRRVLGERGRAFAERWHDPVAVAAGVVAAYVRR